MAPKAYEGQENNRSVSSQRLLRVLSANVCLIAPTGNLRFQVYFAVVGGILVFLLLLYGTLTSPYPLIMAFSSVLALPLVTPGVAHLLVLLTIPLVPSIHEQYKQQRLAALLRHMESYDVVALQEMINLPFSHYYTSQLIERAASLGFTHVAHPPLRPHLPATLCSSGLIILSRFPIEVCDHHIFRFQAWYDYFAVNRAALYARIVVPSWPHPVHLFTTHLAPGDGIIQHVIGKRPEVFSDNAQAPAQVAELVRFALNCLSINIGSHDDITPPSVVFAGDFNFKGGSQTYHDSFRLLSTDFPSLTDIMAVHNPHTGDLSWRPTFACLHPDTGDPLDTLMTVLGDRGHPEAIDHAFSNIPVAHTHVDPLAAGDPSLPFAQVSDHHGIAMTFHAPPPLPVPT